VSQRTETLDLGTFALTSGEGRALEVAVPVDALRYGGEGYAAAGDVEARLDVSRTTGEGYALRLRFDLELAGPCMRCLEPATSEVTIEAREIDQPDGDAEELRSPYLDDQTIDLRSWARDAIALNVPPQILCSESCRGLCPTCGINLNERPGHGHEPPPDPRWAKLSELELD